MFRRLLISTTTIPNRTRFPDMQSKTSITRMMNMSFNMINSQMCSTSTQTLTKPTTQKNYDYMISITINLVLQLFNPQFKMFYVKIFQ